MMYGVFVTYRALVLHRLHVGDCVDKPKMFGIHGIWYQHERNHYKKNLGSPVKN